MSFLTQTNQGVDPSAPAAGKSQTYVGVDGRPTTLNATGVKNVLAARELANLIRNSGMWFAQRQAPGTLTTYSALTGRAISADGWGITNENASVQYIRTDTQNAPETGLQGRFYGTWSKITTTGKLFVSQTIEGVDCEAVRGRTVRLQAWLKASSAKTIKVAVVQLNSAGTVDAMPATFISAVGANNVDPTLGTNLAFLAPKAGVTPDNATAGANAAQCSVTTAWQRFGLVVDVPANAKNVVVLIWSDTQFVAADSLSIAQVSLTDGFEIQDFDPCPYAVELARVQRLYSKTFLPDSNPVQNAGVAGSLRSLVAIAGAVATSSVISWRYPVPMRITPTLTYYNPSAVNAFVRNVPAATDATVTASANADAQSTDVNATGLAGWTAGQEIRVHASADAEL